MKHLATLALLVASAIAGPLGFVVPVQVKYTNVRVGDGNPHQNYLYTQVTDYTECNDGDCSTGHEESNSHTIKYSATFGYGEWISAGFEVSEAQSTGQVNTCHAKKGDRVCVWWRTAHTAYTVQTYRHNAAFSPTKGNKIGQPTVIKSPNKNHVGSGYICGRGDQCDTKGEEKWGNITPFGGPQPFPKNAKAFE
ncbi:hypothetical protein QQS21_000305 [Conoideocrella luteorostrata]|uniref:Uncharacterized protein n=1 Tax=Conoideocrella luteorostrata TaxID=1105319 RepID=A0AAJ0CZ03_9HYPO|nr:hypothetical protein QQS21_000305 [Conoideocrella luteorostrata]